MMVKKKSDDDHGRDYHCGRDAWLSVFLLGVIIICRTSIHSWCHRVSLMVVRILSSRSASASDCVFPTDNKQMLRQKSVGSLRTVSILDSILI
jgi:hypothetical protein